VKQFVVVVSVMKNNALKTTSDFITSRETAAFPCFMDENSLKFYTMISATITDLRKDLMRDFAANTDH